MGVTRRSVKRGFGSPLGVIFDPPGRSDTSLFVRFPLKTTFTNQDAIRRFVP
jgi:hypothetical protein